MAGFNSFTKRISTPKTRNRYAKNKFPRPSPKSAIRRGKGLGFSSPSIALRPTDSERRAKGLKGLFSFFCSKIKKE